MGKKIYLAEAIQEIGLSEFTLRALVRQKKISYFRAGEGKNGKIIFDLDLLQEDLKRLMLANLEPEIKFYRAAR